MFTNNNYNSEKSGCIIQTCMPFQIRGDNVGTAVGSKEKDYTHPATHISYFAKHLALSSCPSSLSFGPATCPLLSPVLSPPVLCFLPVHSFFFHSASRPAWVAYPPHFTPAFFSPHLTCHPFCHFSTSQRALVLFTKNAMKVEGLSIRKRVQEKARRKMRGHTWSDKAV